MLLFLIVVLAAVIFEYSNGFHDAANAIATVVSMWTVLAAVLAGFIWNMTTWWFGLPSSSSHALIGGLCGAAFATAHGNWSVIKWSTGLWPKVIVPMLSSPVAGFVLG